MLDVDAKAGDKTIEEGVLGEPDHAIANTLEFGLVSGDRTRLRELEKRSLMVFKRGWSEAEFKCAGERRPIGEKTVVMKVFVPT